MKDQLAVKIEKRAMLIDSEFENTHYAIDREGKGIWIISDDTEIAIASENVEKFINELSEIWALYKNKGG